MDILPDETIIFIGIVIGVLGAALVIIGIVLGYLLWG